MMGLSKRTSDRRLTIGQAWGWTTELFVASVFLVVLALFVARTPAIAQDSAACGQYGCPEDPAPAYFSPPPSSPAPAYGEPTSAPTSASAPAATVPYEEGTSANEESAPAPDEATPSYEQPVEEPVDDPDDSAEGPLPGYPYTGETCEESDCGLEAVEGPVQCVTYETASGKKVFGCTDPSTFDEEGCYEITFYTEEGKPYSNLDTCSGEKPYAPPDPPKGSFSYWEPPDTPRQRVHGFWMPPWDYCRQRSGDIDYRCGLEDIPAGWSCEVFYGTVHGTVRGCYYERDALAYDSDCIGKLHLYDEVGRFLGAYKPCPRVRKEYCSEDRCAIRNVPDEWWCRTEEWDYGELYSGERRVYTRCADPLADQYITSKIRPKPNRMCGYLWDEQGRVIDETNCSPGQGGSQVGYWAGKEAEEADDTLNDNESPTSPPSRSLLPSYGATDPGDLPDNASGQQEGPVSILVDVITNLLNGKSSSADPQASGSVVSVEPSSGELKNTSVGKASMMVNDEYEIRDANPRDAVGNWSPEGETDATSEGAIPSIAQEAASGATLCHDGRRPCGSQAHGNSGQKFSGNSMQDGRSANRFWPTISGGVREATGFVADEGADGWLSAVVSLTGLGIAGGAFALRTRFLR